MLFSYIVVQVKLLAAVHISTGSSPDFWYGLEHSKMSLNLIPLMY